MPLQRFSSITRSTCDQKAVSIIAHSIQQLLKKQPQVVLGLPGGRSVAGIFTLLKSEKNIPWDKVHLFWVDERLVPLTDKDSNYHLAKELFLDELVQQKMLPLKNIHPFDFTKGITSYQQELQKYGGKYDICLWGAGEDGHIAALFPNHHSVTDKSFSFISFHDSPKPPAGRMTMSAHLIATTDVGIVLFYGDGKREALKRFKGKKSSIADCPAKLLYTIKDSYMLTDLQ